MNPPVKHCRCCGATYIKATWLSLHRIGRMDLDEDGDSKLELRNCMCGTTLAVEDTCAVRDA